jgi:hypothetical protein
VAWGAAAWGALVCGAGVGLVELAPDDEPAAWLVPAGDAVVASAPEAWAVGLCGWLALAVGVDRLEVLAACGESASAVDPAFRASAVAARWLGGAGVWAGAGEGTAFARPARDCAKPSAS